MITILDRLLNDFVFDAQEHRAFTNKRSDYEFLIRYLKRDGVEIERVRNKGYFFCVLAKDGREVCSDSRHNLRPRKMSEAVIVATLKLYLVGEDDFTWRKIANALDLSHEALLHKSTNR